MTHRYGIDTSILMRLLTGEPETGYRATLRAMEKLRAAEPRTGFLASNQVIGEAYIALQHHYGVTKADARAALTSVLTSGLCTPLNGAAVLKALASKSGCGLLDRLIADDYAQKEVTTLTLDAKMAKLEGARKLG